MSGNDHVMFPETQLDALGGWTGSFAGTASWNELVAMKRGWRVMGAYAEGSKASKEG